MDFALRSPASHVSLARAFVRALHTFYDPFGSLNSRATVLYAHSGAYDLHTIASTSTCSH